MFVFVDCYSLVLVAARCPLLLVGVGCCSLLFATDRLKSADMVRFVRAHHFQGFGHPITNPSAKFLVVVIDHIFKKADTDACDGHMETGAKNNCNAPYDAAFGRQP